MATKIHQLCMFQLFHQVGDLVIDECSKDGQHIVLIKNMNPNKHGRRMMTILQEPNKNLAYPQYPSSEGVGNNIHI